MCVDSQVEFFVMMKLSKGKKEKRIGEKKKKRNIEQNVDDVETYVAVNDDGIINFLLLLLLFFFYFSYFVELLLK